MNLKNITLLDWKTRIFNMLQYKAKLIFKVIFWVHFLNSLYYH